MSLTVIRPRMLYLLLIIAASFAVYAPSLTYGLVWDDYDVLSLVRNQLRDGGLIGLFRSEIKLGITTGYYRPITLWSFAVDAKFGDLFPYLYHLTNVLLHVVNSVLVFHLFEVLLFSQRIALLGAMTFSVHPVHSEAVAWFSARSDLLACLFALVACIAWLKERKGGGILYPRRLRFIGFLSFLLALLSKESAVTLLVLLPAWEFLLKEEDGQKDRDRGRRQRVWLTLWVTALGFVILLRAVLAPSGAGLILDRYGQSVLANVITDPVVFFRLWTTYLGLLAVPWPLNTYYYLPSLSLPWTIVFGAVLFLTASAFVARGPYRRIGLIGLVWVVVFLLPVGIAMPTGTPIAERYLYLPSVGYCLVAGMAGERLAILLGTRRFVSLLAIPFVGLLSLVTLTRERIWKSELSLFTDMVRTSPDAAHPHTNLGIAHLEGGRPEEAAKEFEKAIELLPDDTNAHLNLAAAYHRLNRDKDAYRTIRTLVQMKPDNALARTSLGCLYIEFSQYAEGVAELKRAVALDANLVLAQYNLGVAYSKLRMWPETSEALKNVIRLDPLNSKAHLVLGTVFLEMGDVGSAESILRDLESLDPVQAKKLLGLIAVYRGTSTVTGR